MKETNGVSSSQEGKCIIRDGRVETRRNGENTQMLNGIGDIDCGEILQEMSSFDLLRKKLDKLFYVENLKKFQSL